MQSIPLRYSRRRFIQNVAWVCGGMGVCAKARAAEAPARKLFHSIGSNGKLDQAETYQKQGLDFITGSTSDFLVPDQGDEVFAKNLEQLAQSRLPVYACNGFIRPANLRCVGPEANHDQILEWADTAFRRLKQAKGHFMVFGSGGSRALRDGFPEDQADVQFVALLKRLGPLAEKHGIVLVIEQLRAQECNYINRIGKAAELIRKAGHPQVRILADLYHMACGGDTPDDLKAAMDVVVHVEIAEKENRSYPGVKGDDFRPYFRVLRDAGYQGAINIEAKGTMEQLGGAVREVTKQAQDVMAELDRR